MCVATTGHACATTIIPFRGYKIHIYMSSFDGKGDLDQTGMRVFRGRDVTGELLGKDRLDGTADSLLLAFNAILVAYNNEQRELDWRM